MIGDHRREVVAERLFDIAAAQALREQPLLEPVHDDARLRPFAHSFADRRNELLGVTQARHRHFAHDEQPVRAKQHAVGPGEPGPRHVDHHVIEIGRDEIEEPRHHLGIESPHFGRPAGRGNHRESGGVVAQHHFEQLAVEPLRPRLDLVEVEPWFEVEVIGAGAMLEIEVDQHGARPAARAGVQQQQSGLDRERGDAGAADRRQERVDLGFGRLGDGGGARGDPRTGAHQLGRWCRLHQEVGDPHLQEPARNRLVEHLRDHDRGRTRTDARHQTLQRLHLGLEAGVEIDDDHGRIVGGKFVLDARHRAGHDAQVDLRAGAKGRAHRVFELGIGREHDHQRPFRCARIGA